VSQTTVSVYGMLDSTLYDDVATATKKATNLGATVVSSPDMPQLRAVFSDVVDACTFSIWLSTGKVAFHTFQLAQTSVEHDIPWPELAPQRVKASCIQLARDYNSHAALHRVRTVPQDAAELIAEAIFRTPLLTLTQEPHR
jgi:hypothetical protein